MSSLPSLLPSLLSGWRRGEESLNDTLQARLIASPPADVLSCSTQCLNLFVQLNWTGPPCEGVREELESLVGKDGASTLNENALSELSADGEAVYKLCTMPLLLHMAKLLLFSPHLLGNGDVLLLNRWTMRCVLIQQRLLENRSSSLCEVLTDLVSQVAQLMHTNSLSQSEEGELYLELGHVSLYCLQYGPAQEYFEKALTVTNISTELTGVLGKRTRFQQADVAQLTLKVSTDSTHSSTHCPDSTPNLVGMFPREVSLDDDTVLDKIDFTQPQAVQHLSALQQATLLGWCIFQRRSKAIDQLSSEEMEAYLNCVLGSAQCWAVQGHALFLRTQLDRSKYRVQQRNMQQLEELMECSQREMPEIAVRLKLFFSVPYCPVWLVQKELAGVLVKLGCLSSAVDLLSRLQMWEELALCYQAVGRRAQAKAVVQEQLDAEPTPTLLCLMGDITQDVDYYTRAWELSESQSSRAQRSLGLWHLKREEYKESVECLQKSLAVNSLQEGLWFSLGCAASQTGQLDLAISAWHREVTLQPDFAEAWNNLGGAYLKKKEKQRAHRIFKEALRCSYDNPKIWENYLVVSTDLGLWAESLRAYQRLLDILEKFEDEEILKVLVHEVTKGGTAISSSQCGPEISSSPVCEHRDGLGKLLGRVVSRGQVSAVVWQLCGQFHLSSSLRADHVKGVQELQKAQRAARLQSGWDRTVEGVTSVSGFTIDYCTASRQLYGGGAELGVMERKQALAMLSSAKLALQGIISKAKNFGVSSSDAMQELVEELEAEMKRMLEAIAHHSVS